MTPLHLVFEDEGFGPHSPTLHDTQRDALLEALCRLGDDMDEAASLDDASLEETLARLNKDMPDVQVCVAEDCRRELEAMFQDAANMEIPLELEPSFVYRPAPAPKP